MNNKYKINNTLKVLTDLKGIANWLSKDWNKEEAEIIITLFGEYVDANFNYKKLEKGGKE